MSIPTLPSASGARGAPEHAIRERIVLAATEHFRRYGFEKTTVSDLASAIGYSKAYIYKFFESKQAIGEAICSNCLLEIRNAVDQSVATGGTASARLRRMFRVLVEATTKLFSEDRKLYDIAAVAAHNRWPAVIAHMQHLRAALSRIIQEGRTSGEFERKTALDETVSAVYLVMLPYANPLVLQNDLDGAAAASALLAKLVLRSLAP